MDLILQRSSLRFGRNCAILGMVGVARCIAVDLNEILYSRGRSTGASTSNTMLECQDFIKYSALVDSLLRDADFTSLTVVRLLVVQ